MFKILYTSIYRDLFGQIRTLVYNTIQFPVPTYLYPDLTIRLYNIDVQQMVKFSCPRAA